MKRIFVILITLVLVLSSSVFAFATDDDNGFNEKGYNYNARIFNGFYADNLYLVMKWSKDWAPMENEPSGAWCTNHLTWYSNDYSADSWYGYYAMTTFGEGAYKVDEFMKIMKVNDNPTEWAKYQAANAYSAGWGTYVDGVPQYVVYQDTLNVYDAVTGELVYSTDLVDSVNKGVGKVIF